MTTSDSIHWGMSPTVPPDKLKEAVARNPFFEFNCLERERLAAEKAAKEPPPEPVTEIVVEVALPQAA